MKTTIPAARRAQPQRQVRTNAKANDPSTPHPDAVALPVENQGPGFLPALTQFTDAIDAVPREVVRQLALLMEVDAKLDGPDQTLHELTEGALNLAILKDGIGGEELKANAIAIPAQANRATALVLHSAMPRSATDEQFLWQRRRFFFQLRVSLTEVLSSLDEKNGVLSTAAMTLNKYTRRCKQIYPYLDDEISEEARYGSMTHWAYTDKSEVRAAPMVNERPRRDGTGGNGAAALLLADEAAATRSENRQTVRASKNRGGVGDAGANESVGGSKQRGAGAQVAANLGLATTKKATTSKSKRAGEATNTSVSAAPPNIGSSAAADGPPSKRRKAEKAPTGRVVSAAAATTATTKSPVPDPVDTTSWVAAKGSARTPQTTPAPDVGKKRVRAPATAAPSSKKRKTQPGGGGSTAASPSLASSPVNTHFPASDMPGGNRTSTNMQESTPSGAAELLAISERHRPSSSSLFSKTNPFGGNGADAEHDHAGAAKGIGEAKGTGKGSLRLHKESSVETKAGRGGNGDAKSGVSSSTIKGKESVERRTKNNNINDNDVEMGRASADIQQEYYSQPSDARGTGKASKTPTPVSTTFPEITRSRSGRGLTGGSGMDHTTSTSSKRPRKKSLTGGSTWTSRGEHKPGTSAVGGAQYPSTAAIAALGGTAAPTSLAELVSKQMGLDQYRTKSTPSATGDDEPEGNNNVDKRYCICNDFSYGSMVACDSDKCTGEWFHWKCVGLKAEPTGESWFCPECRRKKDLADMTKSE